MKILPMDEGQEQSCSQYVLRSIQLNVEQVRGSIERYVCQLEVSVLDLSVVLKKCLVQS